MAHLLTFSSPIAVPVQYQPEDIRLWFGSWVGACARSQVTREATKGHTLAASISELFDAQTVACSAPARILAARRDRDLGPMPAYRRDGGNLPRCGNSGQPRCQYNALFGGNPNLKPEESRLHHWCSDRTDANMT